MAEAAASDTVCDAQPLLTPPRRAPKLEAAPQAGWNPARSA